MEIILVRHGESTANAGGVLAGRDDSVELTDQGRTQVREARDLIPELTSDRPAAVFSSPIRRCLMTAHELMNVHEPIAAADPAASPQSRGPHSPCTVLQDLSEVDYGDWTGRRIRDLLDEPLWETVRAAPSRARFPGGESLAEVALRSRSALESACEQARDSGAKVAILVSHGDVIKLMLAHALGMEVDCFQRIAVAPASVSRLMVGKNGSVPPMTVTMLGATARGRRAQARQPGGGR
ncbi:histidine phosphatase family protein [Brevibacterium jeotgali]|uniref:Probable phosphomutase, MSMEG_4193 family n=1 Tax=Brevibacterium jeotgali TaxID=1262550 RepID=A0A2H1L381_9MICO|nr:histidine phosphatase family protein [Brevibacterium jeotgali]TWC02851.1 putative phosphomutase (TIGR03848 family) [Brevibacterium jeotgali]SMY10873.1 probable phosphomutase, MSMEG_4193 family [Brevibacterium jeotgali]